MSENVSKSELKHVLLEKIYEADETLRKVDRKDEAYLGLVEAIRLQGVMNPINVREIQKPDSGEIVFGIIDGLQRFSAAKDVGLETIPCHITTLRDAELIEAQILANVHKVETKPVQYSKGLLQLLTNNPLLSRPELAGRLAKTSSWISERLGLLKLTDAIGSLVDESKIGLSNAYALAKLPPEEQNNFVDRAMIMTPQQFAPTVNARVKEIRDAKRKGKGAAPEEFQPVALLRSRSELVAEMEKPTTGFDLIKRNKINSPLEAFNMAVKWVLQLDPESCEIQKAKDEERRTEKKRKNEKMTAERMRKRATEAAEKAVELQTAAEKAEKEEKKLAVRKAAEAAK